MKRPLVWVGIAYVTGIAAAAAGIPLTGILATAAIICIILQTGSKHRETALRRILLLLPVFFVSGFVVFCRAASPIFPEFPDDETASVSVTGTVSSRTDKDSSVAFEILHARILPSDEKKTASREAAFGCVIYVRPEEAGQIRTGDRILAKGRLCLPDTASNPGQFDMRSYLKARGFSFVLFPDNLEKLSSSRSWRVLLQILRQKLAAVFLRLFGPVEGGAACAMILGETASLPQEVRQLYQDMGIIHILAISGLHISLAGAGLFRILLKVRLPRRWSCLLSMFIVLSYGVMTGMSPSTARAVIMFSVSMTALLIGRTYDMMSAAALAALILFTRYPLMITQAGMQFSFGAVCGLGLVFPAYRKLFKEDSPVLSLRSRDKKKLLAMIGPPVTVTLVTLPVTAWHYCAIPLLSLPLNLIVIPAMSILVPLCFLTGLAGLFWLPAGAAAGGGAYTLIRTSLLLCRAGQRLPHALHICGRPWPWMIVLYYFLLILPLILQRNPFLRLRIKKASAARRLLLVTSLAACLLIAVPWRSFSDWIAFLDVGQGDCIFLRCGGRTCLIDGGSTSEKEIGKYVIEPFLKYFGLDHVDYAFVSHADADHISGIEELIRDDMVDCLVRTRASDQDSAALDLSSLAIEHAAKVSCVSAGDKWSIGDWNFDCLYPPSDAKSEDRNSLSMVILVRRDRFRLLLTGDISADQEKVLAPDAIQGCTILKCAHHGSRFASSDEFLQICSPRISLISCAKHNSYGHPAPETIDRLTRAGSRIFCTMQSGALLLQTDGKKLRLRTFLDP